MVRDRLTTTNNSLSPRSGAVNRRGTLTLLITVLVLGLVGCMYLSQASEAAALQHRIQELRQQKEELERQNDQLAYEIAQRASVSRLEKRARELGYVPVWQARFLAVAGYPSQDETAAPAQRHPTERATPSAVAGWWQTVADQFEVWAQSEQP